MLVKYDGTELDAAIINAMFAAYVESPFDPQLVQQAMGADEGFPEAAMLNGYQNARADFHRERNIMLGGSRIPQFFPGEKLVTVNAARPTSNFKDFQNSVLRNVASGMGLSAQQLSNDWSDVNYSSARSAMLEAWKTLSRRRHDFASGFCTPIRMAWLEESMEVDNLPLPAGAPDFIDCRAAYSRCKWLGPGKGYVDPKAEREGAILGLGAGLSTYETEIAELMGEDWEDVMHQRAEEQEKIKSLGLNLTVGLPGGASQKIDEAADSVAGTG